MNAWLDTSKSLDLLTLASMPTGMPRTAPIDNTRTIPLCDRCIDIVKRIEV